MNKSEQMEAFKLFTARQHDILISKGDDYSGADRLSNFKTAWAVAWISPEQQALSLIATKVARLWQLLAGKDPKNESVEDSILDLANYAFLLHCIRAEKSLQITQ